MTRQIVAALAASLAVMGAHAAHAADITYRIDQIIGSGSVTGIITTDGTIGILSAADIVSFDLTLNDGTDISNLSSPATVIINSNACCGGGTPGNVDVTASAADLMFNYSGTDQGFFSIGDSAGELCYTNTSNCWGPTGVGVYNVGGDGRSVYIGQRGDQIIATAVPEVATWAMILLGAGMVGGGLRFIRRGNGMAAATA